MTIIGFNLRKISVEKKETIKGQVNVKTNLKITDIKEEKAIAEISKDRTALKFDFEFGINYEPKIATINFLGHVLSIEEEKKAKKILSEWKDKKIEVDLRTKVTNMIWIKCNIKAFLLEEEIGLPIHIPLPRLTAQK